MNKMKCFSAALVAFFLSATHLCAQDIEKEFDDFAKQNNKSLKISRIRRTRSLKPSCGKRGRSMKHLLRFRLLNVPNHPNR